jgi:Flp pilus assembly protein CpaB
MPPVRPAASRGGLFSPLTIGMGAVLLAAAGGLIWLLAPGWVLAVWPRWKGPRVLIPVNTRTIPAYTTVLREHLLDPQKGTLRYLEIPPEQTIGMSLVAVGNDGQRVQSRVGGVRIVEGRILLITPQGEEIPLSQVQSLGGAILDVQEILGRVVARDKLPNYGFREENFLPRGTRPGVAAGIPPGMQAITLPADRLTGVHSLQPGDRIDVLASIPLQYLDRFGGSEPRGWSALVSAGSASPRPAKNQEGSHTRMVVQDGLLVTGVVMRASPQKSSSLTQGTQVRNIPVQEVVLAVHPDDVPLLSEALSLDAEMTVIAHSGRPPQADRAEMPAGMVAVPLCARPIAALARLQRDDFYHPQTRRLTSAWLSVEDVRRKQIVTEVQQILGRVAARDLMTGEYVTEGDLLPEGTRPGLAAGIPPGKRAYLLPSEQVVGASALRSGDHLDLVASIPLDLRQPMGARLGTPLPLASPWNWISKQAEIRVVAQDAVVVGMLPKAAGNTAGDAAKTVLPDLILAVDAREIADLAQTLASGVSLTAVVRSAQSSATSETAAPRDDQQMQIPGNRLLERMHAIETLVGEKREVVLFFTPPAEATTVRKPVIPISAAAPGAAEPTP